MHLFEKISTAISNKHQTSLAILEENQLLAAPKQKNIHQIIRDIGQEMSHHFSFTMDKHQQNLSKYFSEDYKEGLEMKRVMGAIEEKHSESLEQIGQNYQKMEGSAIQIDVGKNRVERTVRRDQPVENSATRNAPTTQTPQNNTIKLAAPKKPSEQLNRPLITDKPTLKYSDNSAPLLAQNESDFQRESSDVSDLSCLHDDASERVSFDFDFNLNFKNRYGDSIFQKIVTAIEEKQSKANEDFQDSLEKIEDSADVEYPELFQNMIMQLMEHFSETMTEHSCEISNYLENQSTSLRVVPGLLDKVLNAFNRRMEVHKQKFEEDFDKYKDAGQDYMLEMYDFPVDKKTRREQVLVKKDVKKAQSLKEKQKKADKKQPVKQLKSLEIKQTTSKIKQPAQPTVSINPLKQQMQISQTKVQPLTVQSAIQAQSVNLDDNSMNNKMVIVNDKPNLAASEIIVKRDIVKQLQQRRKKLLDKQLKSKKMKARMIKLQPIASRQERLIRQKQAKQKIEAAVDFVKTIEYRKRVGSFKRSEWKQDPNTNNTPLSKTDSTPNKYSRMKQQPLIDESSRMMEPTESQLNAMKLTRGRIPSREKGFILRKPMPYNLYSVNMKEHEQFQLSYK